MSTNNLNEDTSIHWHGIILPASMDGVPGFSNFNGIKPGETFTYKFSNTSKKWNLLVSFTLWFSRARRCFGAIIIEPK